MAIEKTGSLPMRLRPIGSTCLRQRDPFPVLLLAGTAGVLELAAVCVGMGRQSLSRPGPRVGPQTLEMGRCSAEPTVGELVDLLVSGGISVLDLAPASPRGGPSVM
jgi:hypothetical protein